MTPGHAEARWPSGDEAGQPSVLRCLPVSPEISDQFVEKALAHSLVYVLAIVCELGFL